MIKLVAESTLFTGVIGKDVEAVQNQLSSSGLLENEAYFVDKAKQLATAR
jgi:hypothetical protein